jgi:hypothetical protein
MFVEIKENVLAWHTPFVLSLCVSVNQAICASITPIYLLRAFRHVDPVSYAWDHRPRICMCPSSITVRCIFLICLLWVTALHRPASSSLQHSPSMAPLRLVPVIVIRSSRVKSRLFYFIFLLLYGYFICIC